MNNIKSTKKSAPAPCITFLLGVLCSKWLIDHNKQKICIHFPDSKKYLASELKNKFGGSVYLKRNRSRGTAQPCYEMRSRDSFKRLATAVQKTSGIPSEFKELARSYLVTCG